MLIRDVMIRTPTMPRRIEKRVLRDSIVAGWAGWDG
jgi:hypothetical protein